MRLSRALVVSLAIPAAIGLMLSAAHAFGRRGPPEPDHGYVTAESRYGPQTITAPVRISARGRREVRLPGGTWIECRRSCTNTLRQETIDFWHIRSGIDSSGKDGPGYLQFHFWW
jgi:hypothetical protein